MITTGKNILSKKIHILGVAGTFMAGIATIARQMGYEVTGSDQHCYPPMSTYLENLGIGISEGFSEEAIKYLDQKEQDPDNTEIIIGNVMRRGMPVIEEMLDRPMDLVSGPEWLENKILKHRWVLCVSGTHGKTTTASMLSWILEFAGFNPGFLIGGLPSNFGVSARYTDSDFFVIEGDEYDTSFFDKRSKFIHYKPRTLIINNLEFDHADIFDDLKMIQRQFHHLLKILPKHGRVIYPENINTQAISEVLSWGCYSEQEKIGNKNSFWAQINNLNNLNIFYQEKLVGEIIWDLLGQHNINNALSAIAAAHHVGVQPEVAVKALCEFKGVKRRMELKGVVNDIYLFDDFAHHPTAINTTLEGLKNRLKNNIKSGRLIAVFEPRSNTLKSGFQKELLARSFSLADQVFLYQGAGVKWDIKKTFELENISAQVFLEIEDLVLNLKNNLRPGDHVLIMSNGGFENIHERLLTALRNTPLCPSDKSEVLSLPQGERR